MYQESEPSTASGGTPQPELVTETRECGDCAIYKTDPTSVSGRLGICRKHLMGVTMTMRVTYDKAKGTCFEPKSKKL